MSRHRCDRHHHRRRPGASATARSTTSCRGRCRSPSCWPSATTLEAFRRASDNLYERVRALFFLYAIHRFHLPARLGAAGAAAAIPFDGFEHLLQPPVRGGDRRLPRASRRAHGPSDALASALAAAYHELAFQTLADQVRRSVRGGARATGGCSASATPPTTRCASARSCSAARRRRRRSRSCASGRRCGWTCRTARWSDIFFLGMDYPEGARVLNISVDLGVHGRDAAPRAADRGVPAGDRRAGAAAGQRRPRTRPRTSPRWTSCSTSPTTTSACSRRPSSPSGLVPPGARGDRAEPGRPARRGSSARACGLEVVSKVNDIPKGSRLAVSTNLLAALIAVCMRATGQARNLTGAARRSRAPARRGPGDPRRVARRLGRRLAGLRRRLAGHQAHRGRRSPARATPSAASAAAGCCRTTRSSDPTEVPPTARAAAPGQPRPRPRRDGAERRADPGDGHREVPAPRRRPSGRPGRRRSAIFDEILAAPARPATSAASARRRPRNWDGPHPDDHPLGQQPTSPRRSSPQARATFGDDFWGFWMLGGMSGGGMGFIVAPQRKAEAQAVPRRRSWRGPSASCEDALPFAMEPVVYDFAINPRGTFAELLAGDEALMPAGLLRAASCPQLAAAGPARPRRRSARRSSTTSAPPAARGPSWPAWSQTLFDRLLPARPTATAPGERAWQQLLDENGFDRVQHEQHPRGPPARAGSAWPRTACRPARSIEDVRPGDVADLTAARLDPELARARRRGAGGGRGGRRHARGRGRQPLDAGGRAWSRRSTRSAKLGGRHRTFLEVHLAKSRRVGRAVRRADPARRHDQLPDARADRRATSPRDGNYGYDGPVLPLAGPVDRPAAGPDGARPALRLGGDAPADARRAEAEGPRQPARRADRLGAGGRARASDYTDNVPLQCLHPAGHWYEVPNLLRNGVLAGLLAERPQLKYLLRPQHRHARRGPRPGAARPAHRAGRGADVRGHPPADRRPRRRPGPRRRPAPPPRRAGHAARGGRVRPALLQHADDLGRHRRAARGRSG